MYACGAFLAGLVFGVGLLVSGMVNPAKVLGFLDLAGPWDPSLALVMAGAVVVGAVAFAFAGRRASTLLGAPLSLPTGGRIDGRLVLGSLAFGLGWGLAGFCPGARAGCARRGQGQGARVRRRDARGHAHLRAGRAHALGRLGRAGERASERMIPR